LGEKTADLGFACFRKSFLFNRALIIFPVQITIAENRQDIRLLSQGERLLLLLSLMQSFFPIILGPQVANTPPPFCLKQAGRLRLSSRLCIRALSRPT